MAIKGINPGGAGVWHHRHIGCIDGFPTADRGAIKSQALSERFLLEQIGADSEMLPFAMEIGELQVNQFNAFLLDLPEDVLRGFGHEG